jgi:hypothetical protein
MNHDLAQKTKPSEINWNEIRIGRDAVIQEKHIDPKILDLMPREIDTYIDVSLLSLLNLRLKNRFLNLIKSFYSK